ncbi:hypothetical protein [Micromonospora phaseoli]|nr:hypothetical protein [Micromonospora phaseoli]
MGELLLEPAVAGSRTPGVDGITARHIEPAAEAFLEELRADIEAYFDNNSHPALMDRGTQTDRGQACAGAGEGVLQGRDLHGTRRTGADQPHPVHDLAEQLMTQEPYASAKRTSLDQVEDRLAAFEQRYNATVRPFRWKSTPADLEDLLARMETRTERAEPPTVPDRDHQPAALTLTA